MQEDVAVVQPTEYEKMSSQILGVPTQEAAEEPVSIPEVKKLRFSKGDSFFEVDEDAELEFMADKKPLKLTLRELRDRASGDVAVKNRMHALAEEKKKVQGTFKEFADLAKKDPLQALEYIVNKASESDDDLKFESYLQMLAEQGEKLSQMDEPERKIYETEKKLSKVERDLALKDRQEKALSRKSEIISEYPELANQFDQILDAVMSSDEIMAGVNSESDVLDRVEYLMEETLLQRDIIKLIKKVDPAHASDDTLIFHLSDVIKANPDFEEQDVAEILSELLKPLQKKEASKRLSEKQRQSSSIAALQDSGASDLEILTAKLMESRGK